MKDAIRKAKQIIEQLEDLSKRADQLKTPADIRQYDALNFDSAEEALDVLSELLDLIRAARK